MDVTVLLCSLLEWLCYHIADEVGAGRFVGSMVWWLQSTGIVGGLVSRRLDGLRRDVVRLVGLPRDVVTDGWMRGSPFGFSKRDDA